MNTFSLVQPQATETPLIVEVPHAGLTLDPQSMAYCVAPARSIGQDADLLVAELFADAPSFGAHLLYSNVSRYVCDLNRAEDDLDEQTTPSGRATSSPHGVVWRKTTEGRLALSAPLPSAEIERRLDAVYRPYHQTLHELIQAKLQKFGVAVLLSGHSMPSFGRLGERRADVVPGSQGRTTAGAAVLATCERAAAAHGYDVAHDAPYRGGFTTTHYGSPGSGVHALQVELARRIYMEESTLESIPDKFQSCQKFCNQLIRTLGELSFDALAIKSSPKNLRQSAE